MEIKQNLLYTVFADIAFIALLGLGFLINLKGSFIFAAQVVYFAVNAIIAAGSFLEGVAAGNYLVLIPVLLAGTFMIGLKIDLIQTSLFYGVTIASIYISLFSFPQHSTVQHITAAMEKEMYNFNLLITFICSAAITIVVQQMKSNREKIIIHEKQYSDTIFNTSLDCVLITNENISKITDCNKEALSLFGIDSKQALISQPPFSFFRFSGHSNVQVTLKKIAAEKLTWRGELIYIRKDGSSFTGLTNIVPFSHNNIQYFKIGINDVSEVKKANNKARIANQRAIKLAREKTKFLSTMSHELRTPLNGIIGTVNLMLTENNYGQIGASLNVLKNCSEQMLVLINDILDLNKLDANKMQVDNNVFNLYKQLENIQQNFQLQANAKHVKLIFDTDIRLNRDFAGDDLRIIQVLNNLISNAIKFTHKGSITVTTKLTGATSDTSGISFSVRDTGIGIPEDKRELIFRSFTQANSNTTRQYGGTGLGLTISKKIVTMMGGELKVESELNKGSHFYFSLALKNVVAEKRFLNEEKNKTLESLNGIKVLIAEDNPINMMIAKRFMLNWDVTLDEATNGQQAVDLFKEKQFDLLLIDLEMPVMDGYTAISEIRKIDRHITAVAFTAAVFDNMDHILKERGFNTYIQKPFRPQDLHALISRFANKKLKIAS
jgi:PAS domain S-box-containing protein